MSPKESWDERIGRLLWDPGAFGLLVVLTLLVGLGLYGEARYARPAWEIAADVASGAMLLPRVAAPILLGFLLAVGCSRRARAAALLGIMAVLIAGCLLYPIAMSHEVAARFHGSVPSLMMSAEGWSWPQRLQAQWTHLAPDGSPVDAWTVMALRYELGRLALTLVLVLLALTPVLRRDPRKINAWIALAATITTLGPMDHVVRGIETGLSWALQLASPFALFAAFGAFAQGWCAQHAPRARIAWTITGWSILALSVLAGVAPQALSWLAPGIARVGEPASFLAVTTLAGDPVDFHPGDGRVLVLVYRNSSCSPCDIEQRLLEDLKAADPALVVVPVDIGERPTTPSDGDAQAGSPHAGYLPSDLLLRHYPAATVPSTYLIDKRGFVRAVPLGLWREQLEPELRALLAEPWQDR